MFTLINGVIGSLLVLPFVLQSVGADPEAFNPSGTGLISLVAASLYSLATFVPALAVAVRRLHDTSKSGWWYLLSLIPFGSLVLLIFFALDSQPGASR